MSKKFSDHIVLLVIWLNVLFVEQVFALCAFSKAVPDSLIISWFAFTGTELLGLVAIKITKVKKMKHAKVKKVKIGGKKNEHEPNSDNGNSPCDSGVTDTTITNSF